jgi:hydroxylamine reductase
LFCNQCEQTSKGIACTQIGVCGKSPETAGKQDETVAALIELARAAEGKKTEKHTDTLVMESLFATLTNVDFDPARFDELNQRIAKETAALGGGKKFAAEDLFKGETDIVSLRSTLLFGMKGMAAYAWHAHVLGKYDPEVSSWFYKGLRAVGSEHTVDEWLGLIMEFGQVNLKCMALLDEANTSTFGHPVPTKVSLKVEKGPFIVVSGHDLLDLKQLLDQTQGKGINIYTHGEMLPAHAYPGLKKYAHLKGNFGTAWQNQQHEFTDVPAAFLFTTNCLMLPKQNYRDNVFTTSIVGCPGVQHIDEKDGKKDFSPVIKRALHLGGWKEDRQFTGINGGTEVTTGFARNTVMGVADHIIGAVKSGAIKHFFLVGGCDGAKPGRNYYTDFVKATPADTAVLTLACGKYRFNDLDIGQLGPMPRILDVGQCNDAYSAIQIAVALAGAFNCGVNELPLSLVLSWYEQKAVCILLTLLSLNIKNIYLGPTLPAFISPNVLKVLVDKFNIKPVTTPEADLKAILG